MMVDPTLLYLSGSNLDGPQGTDRQLAEAVAQIHPVTWVDPPVAIHRMRRRRTPEKVAPPGMRYVPTWGPPFITRRLVRPLSRRLYQHQVRRAGPNGEPLLGQVLSGPLQYFTAGLAPRVLFLTDDWEAGAELMGLSTGHVRSVLRRNLDQCDVLAAVTQHLLDRVARDFGYTGPTLLLPNACDASRYRACRPRPPSAPRGPYALLLGQINERLDLEILQSIVDSSAQLVIAGAYRGRSAEFGRRFSRLTATPGTQHLGHLDLETLVGFVQHAHVGLTPYRLDDFNLSSSPLKTWDYLSAGIPVVSTELPASTALLPTVVTASDTTAFVQAVHDFLDSDPSDGAAERRSAAEFNSWSRSATRLVQTLHCD